MQKTAAACGFELVHTLCCSSDRHSLRLNRGTTGWLWGTHWSHKRPLSGRLCIFGGGLRK